MNKRQLLSLLLLLLTLSGLSLLAMMFGSSWSVNAKSENAAWVHINTTDLSPGSAMEATPFWVYHRTHKEMQNGEAPFTFVWGYASYRGCPIKFVRAGAASDDGAVSGPYTAINHYIDVCEGAIFTTSGDHIQGTGHPQEANLRIPKVKPNSDGGYFVYSGKG